MKWKVITPGNLPKNGGWVFYALSPKDYENLALTQADTLRFVKEAKWLLGYYKGQNNIEREDRR